MINWQDKNVAIPLVFSSIWQGNQGRSFQRKDKVKIVGRLARITKEDRQRYIQQHYRVSCDACRRENENGPIHIAVAYYEDESSEVFGIDALCGNHAEMLDTDEIDYNEFLAPNEGL